MNEEQARPVVEGKLRRVAEAGETIAYSRVADEVGWGASCHRPLLGRIGGGEARAGRPLLTAVVVRKDIGVPGDGFLDMAKSLGGAQMPELPSGAGGRNFVRFTPIGAHDPARSYSII